MQRILILILVSCLSGPLFAQTLKILTWNIQDLGRSKSPAELAAMVEVMRDYDLVLIQEVVAKDPAGAQRVAQLADDLDRTGSNWDYRVSDPTHSPSVYISERYAMLWQAARLRLKRPPRLDVELAEVCDREPYFAAFLLKGSPEPFYVITFHARRFDNDPQLEIRHFTSYSERLGSNFLICGDFNLDEQHPVWDPLEAAGLRPVVQRTPTTLKRKCQDGDYFNYPIDNIFYPTQHWTLLRSGRVDFVGTCTNLEAARGISDHLPVWAELEPR